jgi:hypothetical protein
MRRKSNRAIRTKSGKILLPKPQKGALGEYTIKKSKKSRRRSLREDVEKIGYTSTMRDLNLRATLTKRIAPRASKKMRKDMEYLRRISGKSKSNKSNSSRKNKRTRSKSARK